MMKRQRRIVSILLIVVLLCSVSGCSGEQKPSETTAASGTQAPTSAAAKETTQAEKSETTQAGQPETTVAEETVPSWTADDSAEITILVSSDTSPDADNLVLQELEKQTNTKINIITVSGSEYSTKLNTMIAADDVPDVFWSSNINSLDKYLKAGILADMKAVLEAKAPNVIEETKDIIPRIKANENAIYLIPNADRLYPANVVIRTDWLENLNLEMPTDLDSFAKVMHAFTYDDPDGNGIKDTYGYAFEMSGFTGSGKQFINIFGAFGIPKGQKVELEDGTVTAWFKHPNFMKAMTYIRGLIDDGVVEPDFVTIPRMEMFGKFWTGQAGCLEWDATGPANNWYPTRYTEDPPPTLGFATIKGEDGTYGLPEAVDGLGSGWVVSANCKNMEGVARIANFCMSEEGADLLYLGVENVMYRWIDKEKGEVEYLGDYVDTAVHRAAGGYVYSKLFKPSSPADYRTLMPLAREGVQLAWDNTVLEWVYISQASEVRNEYGSDMDGIITEMITEMLLTTEDLQTVYDRYIKEWEETGGSAWEEEMTGFWEEERDLWR